MAVSAKGRPSIIVRASAQNGFGGYSTSWVLINEEKGAGHYEYTGSCTTLEISEGKDLNERLIIGYVRSQLGYTKIEGMIDLDRVSAILETGKYGSIKRISDLDFEQISDLIP